jgi:hypothetical protein
LDPLVSIQQSLYSTPSPECSRKAAVGSIWATVRTNATEGVSATALRDKVCITTGGWIRGSQSNRRRTDLPILGYRTTTLHDPLAVSLASAPQITIQICFEILDYLTEHKKSSKLNGSDDDLDKTA